MMLHDLMPRTLEGALAVLGAWGGLLWSATLQDVEPLLWWYVAFVSADLVTGIWAACKCGEWSADILARGMMKKAIAFSIIILAHGLDVSFWYILNDLPVFQCVTLAAYSCGEFGSVVENVCKAGYGDALPPALKRIFLTLEDRLEHAVDKKLDAVGLEDKPEKKDKDSGEEKK